MILVAEFFAQVTDDVMNAAEVVHAELVKVTDHDGIMNVRWQAHEDFRDNRVRVYTLQHKNVISKTYRMLPWHIHTVAIATDTTAN